jgi:hypothetical protein
LNWTSRTPARRELRLSGQQLRLSEYVIDPFGEHVILGRIAALLKKLVKVGFDEFANGSLYDDDTLAGSHDRIIVKRQRQREEATCRHKKKKKKKKKFFFHFSVFSGESKLNAYSPSYHKKKTNAVTSSTAQQAYQNRRRVACPHAHRLHRHSAWRQRR